MAADGNHVSAAYLSGTRIAQCVMPAPADDIITTLQHSIDDFALSHYLRALMASIIAFSRSLFEIDKSYQPSRGETYCRWWHRPRRFSAARHHGR